MADDDIEASITVFMTFRDVNDLVHYVHATRQSTIEKVCGGITSYLPHELSDSDKDPPTCLWCVVSTGWWKRPPFDTNDRRFQSVDPPAGPWKRFQGAR